LVPADFWKKRQADFEKYSSHHSELTAHWNAQGCVWWLQYGQSAEGVLHPPQQSVDVFAVQAIPTTAPVANAPFLKNDRRFADCM
jgi:hypothetical protein